MIRILTILIQFVFLVASTNVFAAQISTKYQNVFYPNGMPVKTCIYGTGATEYKLYDELAIPNTNLTIVVFSEDIVLQQYLDTKYSVFISVLKNVNNVISIQYLSEITNYLALTPEGVPGYFMTMNGKLNYFNISNNVHGVHLNITNVLSGSGGQTSSSDIFFSIDNNSLNPILELIDDGDGGRVGLGYLSFSYNFIYLSVNSSGITDIITQEYDYTNDSSENIFISSLSPSMNIYTYDNSSKKYSLSGQITSLPSNAVKLNRLYEPDINKLTQEGCCP